jgi:hypothetical protein
MKFPNIYLTQAQPDQKTYGASYLMGQEGIGHDAENRVISFPLDSRLVDTTHRGSATIERTGKGGEIVLALHQLTGLIHGFHVQHFGHEQRESSTKRRPSIAIQDTVTVLPTQSIAPDIEIIASPVSRFDRDVFRQIMI